MFYTTVKTNDERKQETCMLTKTSNGTRKNVKQI